MYIHKYKTVLHRAGKFEKAKPKSLALELGVKLVYNLFFSMERDVYQDLLNHNQKSLVFPKLESS